MNEQTLEPRTLGASVGHRPRLESRLAAGLSLAALGLGAWLLERSGWPGMGVLLLLGAALGLALYHAAFGFTSAWRVFISARRGAGLRAQLIMLAVASVLFAPALLDGELFGRPVVGAVAPLGVSLLVGAFLFGLGMQLGGGCGSGTLVTAGSGNARMLVTLAFFIVGSLLGSAHAPWWFERPDIGSVSLLARFGIAGALAIQLPVLALIALLTIVLERRRHGRVEPVIARGLAPDGTVTLPRRLLQGPWPLLWGALALALLNWATLASAGHPWGITYGFTLWGAKLASLAGIDVASWEFWRWSYHARALAGSVFDNTTSVMDMGVMLGALLAAGIAGRFRMSLHIAPRPLLAAVLGGLLMGYGARLAFGCNIGAFFSGVASASVHGWVWFVLAFAGNAVGTWLRPTFRLPVER